MKWRLVLVVLAMMPPRCGLADTSILLPTAPSQMCRQAIDAAERAYGIPSHLLAAIARVESGRRDDASNTFNPWPWTINSDGQGSFYESKTQAVAAALTMRAKAVHSVDVGCMQISLTYHPNAFTGMDQAFDPHANADYAARFLLSLYEKTSSWPRAVEMYHSATPELGRDYQQNVYAVWPEEKRLADLDGPLPVVNATPGAIGGSWGMPFNRVMVSSLFRQSTPHIIPMAAGLTGAPSSPGRTLDAYRAAPVRLASRLP